MQVFQKVLPCAADRAPTMRTSRASMEPSSIVRKVPGVALELDNRNPSESSDSGVLELPPQPVVARITNSNPHATFSYNGNRYEATNTAWKKWQPDMPTSPHWYDKETLRDLISGYLSREREPKSAKHTTHRNWPKRANAKASESASTNPLPAGASEMKQAFWFPKIRSICGRPVGKQSP